MARLKDQLDRIEEKLDKTYETTVVNTANLVEHMRRTKNVEDRLEPLEKHQTRMEFLVQIVIVLGVVAGIVTAVAALWPHA